MNKKTYLIEKAEKGLTIQQYLKQIAGFSNAQIRSMKFTENGICLGGQRVRVTTRLSEGDVLEVLLETKSSSSAHLLSFEQMPDILYEDADVIAVNKPAGMAVHPSHGHYQDTLANQLAYYFRKNTQQVEIHSIGRLDLETSGIVLFARHRAAAARLSRQREDGRLQKTYLAICSGIFAEKNGTLNGAIAPFARKPDENVCFKRRQTGSHTLSGAETVYGSGTGAAYPGNRTNTPDSRTYGRCRASADWRSAVFCGHRSKSRCGCRELLCRHQTGSTSCIQNLFLSAI